MTDSRRVWARWRVAVGYPLAAGCLWLAHPDGRSVLLGSCVAAVGLIIRGVAAGTLRKGEVLATGGLYAHTRNPLYFGSAFLAAAFGIASRSWLVTALLGGFFAVFYYQTMRREETELRMQYGQAFEEYARRVPLFWPRLSVKNGGADETAGAPAGSGFSWPQYLRNREYRAGIGVALLMGVFAVMVAWRK